MEIKVGCGNYDTDNSQANYNATLINHNGIGDNDNIDNSHSNYITIWTDIMIMVMIMLIRGSIAGPPLTTI